MRFSFYLYTIVFLTVTQPVISQNNEILSETRLKNYLSVLGSDSLEGRATGSDGIKKAAGFISGLFDRVGLLPAGDNNSYLQNIPMHGSTPLPASKLTVYTADGEKKLELGKDYLLYKSGEQTYTPVPRSTVFAGYGITAPEFDYNDYQDIDASGKISVVLDGEPFSGNRSFFEGEAPTIYSYPESKLRIAMSRGAAGNIVIPGYGDDPFSDWQQTVKEFAFEDVTLAYRAAGSLSLLVNPASAGYLFEGTGYTFRDIEQMHLENKVTSFPLEAKLSFKGEFKRRDFLGSNVIGIVEGSDPDLKDTYLLVSAHYDHLGVGPAIKGDSVYNGVMDNAIGTAAVMMLAEKFASLETKPKRSVIFLLTTGEEKGLLGSRYYTGHPVVPLHKTIANINVDGIAFIDSFKSVIGVGKELSSLGDILEKTASEETLSMAEIPPVFKSWESFNRSDQIAFAQAGIPSLLVMEGPDFVNIPYEEGLARLINYNKNIYHTPFDDLNQPINYKAAIQHINLLYRLCYNIADSENEPEWKEGSPYINARLRSRAEGE